MSNLINYNRLRANYSATPDVITVGNVGFSVANSTTFSFTNNGDCVVLHCGTVTAGLTSATYGGVAMTQIGTSTLFSPYSRWQNLWILTNPPQGANNFVINNGNSYKAFASLSGVHQTTPFSGAILATGTAQNPSASLTTTIDNAYVFASGPFGPWTSAGAGTTHIVDCEGAGIHMHITTDAVATAGTGTINMNGSSSFAYQFKMCQLNTTNSVPL